MFAPHPAASATGIASPRCTICHWLIFASVSALAVTAIAPPVPAANGTWSSTATTGAWQTAANWVGGTIPGATSGTTNGDTANFINAGNGQTTITTDVGRNLKNITFDTNAAAYTIGTTSGNPLLLTSSGEIEIANTFSVSFVPEMINAPLTLEGSYTFADNDPTHTDLLAFGGAITSGIAGTQTLTVAGNADTRIDGAIGGGTGTIVLVLNGTSTGRLFLGGNNTFTGGVTINAGTLILNNVNALGSTTPITFVANGATLDLGGQSLGTGPPLSIQGNGVGGNGALISSGTSAASFAGAIDLGGPGSFSVGGSGDITLSGGFSAPSHTLTKVGTNTLTLSGTTDDFGLIVTVNSGTVILGKTSSPTVHAVGGTLTINAGTVQLSGTGGDQIADSALVFVGGTGAAFDTNGRSESVQYIVLSGTGVNFAGALVDSASGPSVLTPGITNLNADTTIGVTQSGGTLTLNNEISGSNKAISKVGLGTLVLTGLDSKFPGPITVYSGTLQISGCPVTGDLTNVATFIYSGTGFGGQLTNGGTAIFNTDFTAGNGMNNVASVFPAPGVNITLNGLLSNSGLILMTGGTLTLTSQPANTNSGTISLTSHARLTITGTTLTNTGLISLDGGLVSAAAGGLLTNGPGGDIAGTGTIETATFANSGLLSVGSGAINVTTGPSFTNSGVIQLTAFNSALTGGAVTNTGSIQGLGNISNAVTNSANGTIEAIGGTLFLGGTLTNQSGAIIRAATGNKVLVTQGLPTNAGIINLVGGTFDNNGHALNNTRQTSGFGIFATGGTGLDNNGSITFSGGLTTVNGPVTNEGGRTITVAQNNAIFTGLVTNNASATFNAINAVATFAGGFVNNGNSNFVKAGGGTVEIDAAPTLSNGSTLSVTTGTLRFNVVNGAPTIGTGVTAVVSAGATLELAGSVSALANGPNRVNISNSSNAPGILVSGTHQQVGNINGSGTTQVKGGSDLTANHIIQSALVIGGTAKNPGLATIDASDASGNPLANSSATSIGLISMSSVAPSATLVSGIETLSSLAADDERPADTANLNVGAAAVPEPATLLLIGFGGLTFLAAAAHRGMRKRH